MRDPSILQAVTIEYDIMTPLQDYLISYGCVDSIYAITATLDNVTTSYKLFFNDCNGNIQVGISARNSVGQSQFTFVELAVTGTCMVGITIVNLGNEAHY